MGSVMYRDKCVFVMPTYNTYEKYDEDQKKPKKKRKTLQPVGEVLDESISEVRRNLRGDHGVIVINDGCTDRTEQELDRLLRKRKFSRVHDKRKRFSMSRDDLKLSVTIIESKRNQGLTPAVVSGYKEALRSIPPPIFVIKLDSDGFHSPSKFPILLDRIRKKNTNIECFSDDDQGFGFRILRSDALRGTMPDLQRFSRDVQRKFPNPEDRRGVDKKTKHLIEALAS